MTVPFDEDEDIAFLLKDRNELEQKSPNNEYDREDDLLLLAQHTQVNEEHMKQLTSLFPDCDPQHLEQLLHANPPSDYDPHAMNRIVQLLLDDANYPKRMIKEPLAAVPLVEQLKDVAFEKHSHERAQRLRTNFNYRANAFDSLLMCFHQIPKGFVRSTFLDNHHLYAPAYLALEATLKMGKRPYQTLKSTRAPPDPGDFGGLAKIEKSSAARIQMDPEFLIEAQYLKRYLNERTTSKDEELARQLNFEEYKANESLLECGCCYDEFPFEDMVQCTEGHLFCAGCARRAAEEKLGLRKTDIQCISGDGCKAEFPRKDMLRFLGDKLFRLFLSIVQEQEITKAVQCTDEASPSRPQEFYVTCPFCPFGAIMETSPEANRLFECLGCGVHSCRLCQGKSHIPLSCEEVKKDKTIGLQHQVEEAMTLALLRSCPSCGKRFFKVDGCNKMTCTCGTIICYVCRKTIKGYGLSNVCCPEAKWCCVEHFNGKGACPLHDDTNQRNAQDVEKAAKTIAEELQEKAKEAGAEDFAKHQEALLKDLNQHVAPVGGVPGHMMPGYVAQRVPPVAAHFPQQQMLQRQQQMLQQQQQQAAQRAREQQLQLQAAQRQQQAIQLQAAQRQQQAMQRQQQAALRQQQAAQRQKQAMQRQQQAAERKLQASQRKQEAALRKQHVAQRQQHTLPSQAPQPAPVTMVAAHNAPAPHPIPDRVDQVVENAAATAKAVANRHILEATRRQAEADLVGLEVLEANLRDRVHDDVTLIRHREPKRQRPEQPPRPQHLPKRKRSENEKDGEDVIFIDDIE